jgi:uncharacterized protein (TIGR03437 family)
MEREDFGVRNRVLWIIAALSLAFTCRLALAQSTVNGVRIYTEPAGAYFTVDGENFQSSASFLWPSTSKHVISSYDQIITSGTRFTFGNTIQTNLGELKPGVPITADPALKWIKLQFATEYLLTYDLPDCPVSVNPCPSGGTINGVDRRTQLWLGAGSTFTAVAAPNSGYIFVGWGTVWELGQPTQFIIKFPMLGPLTLTAFFHPANAVKAQVNVVTNPPQLQVLLDRTPYTAPADLEWGWNTSHAVGAVPVQIGQGVTYVFESWSDGGAINHEFQVPSQSGTINLMAKFVPATTVAFQTSPPGLGLNIDARQNWPNYNFAWLPGSTHQISAPATQTDSQGHKYRFVSWSNGKPASFDYVAGPAPGNEHITAVYQAIGAATIASVPVGLSLQVDGANCITPCSIERDRGIEVIVSAPPAANVNDSSRLVFQGWPDGGGPTRGITITSDPATYTATYRMENRLVVAADPVEGSTFVVAPQSADGFYDSGAEVTITARPALGFRIKAWAGSTSGSSPSITIPLDSPKSALLVLDRTPAIADLGVRNAASDAVPGSVAPGSLISIFGGSLAARFATGPGDPLAQTIENVTVRVDGLFLPLLFVSPEQINAQLASGLQEGKHTLVVRWEGMPEATAEITVARNAPGLFGNRVEDRVLGFFARSNGTAVTPDNPARPNELISVLGTGLGAYVKTPPDGFLLDEAAGYWLADSVGLNVGSSAVEVLYAGRSSAGVGIDAVQFRVPVPSNGEQSTSLPVAITVNGQQSNTVLLPVCAPK